MNHSMHAVIAINLLGLGLAGCNSSDHKPDKYNKQRPSPTELNSRDRGLQSSDLIEATDMLAMKLLAHPVINRSPTKLTIVFTGLEDLTTTRQFNYDIFVERLKIKVAEAGSDRVAVISNKDKFYYLRNKELDAARGERDDRGNPAPPPANRIQPNYAMTGKVMEIRNRATSYYSFTFSLVDINGQQQGVEPIVLGYETRVDK